MEVSMRRFGREITGNSGGLCGHGHNECSTCHPDIGDKGSSRRKAKKQIIQEYIEWEEFSKWCEK